MRFAPLAFFASISAAALLLNGCGQTPASGVAVYSAFRPYLSDATKALVSIDVESLKKSELYQRHQQSFDLAALNAFAERTGLDPRRDLLSLLISWDGQRPLILGRGKFTTDKLVPQLTSLGIRSGSYKAHALFDYERDSVAFPANGLAVGGTGGVVRAALDLGDARTGSVPEALAQRLSAVPKSSQIWEVSEGGLPFAEARMRSDLESALSNIAGFVSGTSTGITLGSGADLNSEITCVSEEGARRVHDALRGVIGLARLSTDTNKLDLLRLWDALHVDRDKQVVHVRASLPADLADKLIAELPAFRSRAGALLNR